MSARGKAFKHRTLMPMNSNDQVGALMLLPKLRGQGFGHARAVSRGMLLGHGFEDDAEGVGDDFGGVEVGAHGFELFLFEFCDFEHTGPGDGSATVVDHGGDLVSFLDVVAAEAHKAFDDIGEGMIVVIEDDDLIGGLALGLDLGLGLSVLGLNLLHDRCVGLFAHVRLRSGLLL